MIFMGASCSWRAYLPLNLSRAAHCTFSHARFPVFLCLHTCPHRSLCFPVFPYHWRCVSTVHTPFFLAFQPPISAGSEYCSHDLCFPFVFRLWLQHVEHVMPLLTFALLLLKQALHDVCLCSWTCSVSKGKD